MHHREQRKKGASWGQFRWRNCSAWARGGRDGLRCPGRDAQQPVLLWPSPQLFRGPEKKASSPQEEGLCPSLIITLACWPSHQAIFRVPDPAHVTQPMLGQECRRMAEGHDALGTERGQARPGAQEGRPAEPSFLPRALSHGCPGRLQPSAPPACGSLPAAPGSSPRPSMENLMSEFQPQQRMWPDLHLLGSQARGPRGLGRVSPSLQASGPWGPPFLLSTLAPTVALAPLVLAPSPWHWAPEGASRSVPGHPAPSSPVPPCGHWLAICHWKGFWSSSLGQGGAGEADSCSSSHHRTAWLRRGPDPIHSSRSVWLPAPVLDFLLNFPPRQRETKPRNAWDSQGSHSALRIWPDFVLPRDGQTSRKVGSGAGAAARREPHPGRWAAVRAGSGSGPRPAPARP
ncbi:atrophin-1-like [Camelus ferus]|uniref:Atrophin-1-like n=1 Tax=Camelus ferus TaxID=419612 RepID=A0A8B8U054_CAMFR|nr:atrophin-1-like [Camelus ferus]